MGEVIQERYALFLDDLREPPTQDWVVTRSYEEAVSYVEQHGMPTMISFDHDLGDDVPTGYDFAKWLVNRHLDEIAFFPENFSYNVHSANPPGAANIQGLLDGFLQFISQ